MENIRSKLTYTGHGKVFRYNIFGRKVTTDTNLVGNLQLLTKHFDVICKSCFRNRKNLTRPLDCSFEDRSQRNTKTAGKHKNLATRVNM